MATSPAEIFCKILQNQYNTKIDLIEAALYLPLRGIREVKSNILRVEKLVYVVTKTELTRIENLLIEVLFLDQINQLASVSNFCAVAFQCSKLVEVLVDSSYGYLSFLDATTLSLVSADYSLFEKHVCILGLRQIVSNFTTDILAELRARLVVLQDELDDQLRLDEIRERYLEILDDSGIFDLFNELKKFLLCSFEVCDWASTAQNALDSYSDKLAVVNTSGSSWTDNIEATLLDNYNDLQDELDTKISDLISLIDNRNPTRGILKDEAMLF